MFTVSLDEDEDVAHTQLASPLADVWFSMQMMELIMLIYYYVNGLHL